jgi:hypothetical protein
MPPRSTKRLRPATRPQLPPRIQKLQMKPQLQRKLPTMSARARRTP